VYKYVRTVELTTYISSSFNRVFQRVSGH